MNEVSFQLDPDEVADLAMRFPHAHYDGRRAGGWSIQLFANVLRINSPGGRTDYPWRHVHGIEPGPGGAMIAAGADLVWIPRSAFREWSAFERFISRLIIEIGQRKDHDRCPQCGYDLRAAPDAGCPECGWRRQAD